MDGNITYTNECHVTVIPVSRVTLAVRNVLLSSNKNNLASSLINSFEAVICMVVC